MLEDLEKLFKNKERNSSPSFYLGSVLFASSSTITHSHIFAILIIPVTSIVHIVVRVEVPNINTMVVRWNATTYNPLDFTAIQG